MIAIALSRDRRTSSNQGNSQTKENLSPSHNLREHLSVSDMTLPNSLEHKRSDWGSVLRLSRFCSCNFIIKVDLATMGLKIRHLAVCLHLWPQEYCNSTAHLQPFFSHCWHIGTALSVSASNSCSALEASLCKLCDLEKEWQMKFAESEGVWELDISMVYSTCLYSNGRKTVKGVWAAGAPHNLHMASIGLLPPRHHCTPRLGLCLLREQWFLLNNSNWSARIEIVDWTCDNSLNDCLTQQSRF